MWIAIISFFTFSTTMPYKIVYLSNKQPQCLATNLSIADFLPSNEDYQALRDNFAVHLARIAVKKFSAFKFLEEGVPQHIIHCYSKELSRPSHFVSKTVTCSK